MPATDDEAERVDVSLPVSRFIGRRKQLASLAALFEAGARLVTVWGGGGMGKTRLALQFAADYALERRVGRPYVCELAEAEDLIGLCTAMGRCLEVPLPSGESGPGELAVWIGRVLAGREAPLVVLDGFERVAELAPQTVTRWLRAAPEARFVVTSRERLRVEGEVVEELGPLDLTADNDGKSSEAVELFLDRAGALGFVADEEALGLARELVAELEGIPLAIELAAGRVDLLGLEGLLEPMRRLTDPRDSTPPSVHPRLDVLSGGRRDMTKRQRTVRATIAWSWDLLNRVEQRALAQCAVFRGGFTPAAVTQVLDLPEGSEPTLEVIQSLRNKSLLRSYQAARGQVRLSLYESVREFAASKLDELGERAEALCRHQAFFLDVASRLLARGSKGLDALTAELENLMEIARRALAAQPLGPHDATVALRALAAAGPVYTVRGPIGPYLSWLDIALAAADAAGSVPAPVRAAALRARGSAQAQRGRAADGLLDLAAALEAARATGDRAAEGNILIDTGVLHHHVRNIGAARACYEEALAIHRGLGERHPIGRALGNLGALSHDLKDFEQALSQYGRALEIFRETCDRRAEGLFHTNIGVLHHERADHADAERFFDRALAILREVGDRRFEAITLGNLGALYHETGRLEDARNAHLSALARIREFGDRRSEALCLTRLASVLAEEARLDEAAARFAAAEELLGGSPDAIALEVLSVSRGFLEAAHARQHRGAGELRAMAAHIDRARARIARARAGTPEAHAPAEVDDTIRVAIRILERWLDTIDTVADEALAPPEHILLVGPEGHWVRPPYGTWQDLRRRRALRRIMCALVDASRSGGAPLALDDLREAGWPAESMQHEAAVNRVHVALAELRKRGLKRLLLRSDEGYFLDPAVEVRQVPHALCPS